MILSMGHGASHFKHINDLSKQKSTEVSAFKLDNDGSINENSNEIFRSFSHGSKLDETSNDTAINWLKEDNSLEHQLFKKTGRIKVKTGPIHLLGMAFDFCVIQFNFKKKGDLKELFESFNLYDFKIKSIRIYNRKISLYETHILKEIANKKHLKTHHLSNDNKDEEVDQRSFSLFVDNIKNYNHLTFENWHFCHDKGALKDDVKDRIIALTKDLEKEALLKKGEDF
jgi:hypothetical protein